MTTDIEQLCPQEYPGKVVTLVLSKDGDCGQRGDYLDIWRSPLTHSGICWSNYRTGIRGTNLKQTELNFR